MVSNASIFSASYEEDSLAQLDAYFRSRFRNDISSDPNELLSVAEFLFGQKILSSALSIVDSRHSLITKLVAPSGRIAYAIRSSTNASTPPLQYAPNTNATFENPPETQSGNYYLCLLSPNQSIRSPLPLRYCSCRSFLEKATKKTVAIMNLGDNGYNQNKNKVHDEHLQEGPPTCKHLLALSLLPHLVSATAATNNSVAAEQPSRTTENHYCCPEIKSVTEEEFASLILDRIL